MIAASTGLFAEFNFVGIATEISVQCEWDEVLVDELRIDLVSGEPPGTVRGAGSSRSPQRTAVGCGKDY
jgi:hypothetical protein